MDDIDVAAQPKPSASPLAALGVTDSSVKELTGKLADNQRSKIAATDKIAGEVESAQSRMLPRIEELSKNVGVEAEKLKPWDADAESAKRKTDPIAAFGSLGSVFGIVASAFTHAPMENALNASAAAMNAIKQNDKESYDRAERAWMQNYKMALDRHRIQHEAYQDAVSLLNVNMAAANTKLQLTAARFGDKQVLSMLEAGMSKEVQDIIESRQRTALQLQQQMPRIVEENAKISRLFALGYDSTNPQSPQSQEAYQKFRQEQTDIKLAERAYTPEQSAYAQFIKERPDSTPEERAEYIQKLRVRKNLTPEQEATTAFIEQNPNASAEDLKAFVTDLRSKSRGATLGGNTALTGARQRAADVKAYRDELAATVNEDGTPKYTANQIADMAARRERELATQAAPLASGARLKVDTAINNITTAEKVLGDMEEMLKRRGIVGFAGALARKGETLANIFGANSSDYHEFAALHATLKRMMPGIITGSNATRFKQEISEMDKIVAGTQLGDTLPSVSANYKKLHELFNKIKPDLDRLRKGVEAPINTAPTPSSGRRPWERAPIKVPAPQSAIEPDSEVV